MPLTGATGYDTVVGSSAPSSSLTDFTLYVDFVPSSAWSSAFAAQGGNLGQIRVTSADGSTEYARDVLPGSTSSRIYLRVLWPGAQSGTPTVRVYPDATGSYAASDTYGQYAAYVATLMYFPMEESSGNLTNRASGSSATMYGSPTYGQTGKLGSAIRFDGTSAYAVAPSLSLASFTAMGWISISTLGDFYQRVFDRIYNGQFAAYVNKTRELGIAVVTTGGSIDVPSTGQYVLSSGFTHVAWRYQSGRASIFVNGTESWFTTSGVSGNMASSSDSIAIGQRLSGTPTRYYSGLLDDLHLCAGVSDAWIGYEYTITNGSFWTDSGWTSLAAGAAATAWAFRKYVLGRRG